MKFLIAVIVAMLMAVTARDAKAQPFAYVPDSSAGKVSVINTVTNTVVAVVPVGTTPRGVAVAPGGARAYVTNEGTGNVSVIDTTNFTVVATVQVGATPVGVAINPAAPRAYVTNYFSSNVSVIDTTTNTVIATVAVGSLPHGVAVNPAGTRVYVTSVGSSNISVIDTSNNTVLTTVATGTQPHGVVVNPAGTRAYVTNNATNSVTVIDATNNAVLTTVGVGASPYGIAVNSAGTFVYVANGVGSNSVSVIDTGSNAVVGTVPVGTNPFGISVNPAGTRVYVANTASNDVSVIDTGSNAVVASVAVGAPLSIGQFVGGPAATVPGAPTIGIATAGFGNATVVYTPSPFNGGSTVATYTATSSPGGITGVATGGPIIMSGLTPGTPYTFTVTATNANGTSLPSAPSNSVTPSASPPGSFAYITNSGSNNVSVIDTATNTVVSTVPVGTSPFAVAVNPAGARAYVANFGSDSVSAIDATNSVVATVAVGIHPQGVALNPAGTRAYVANVGSNTTVSVIDIVSNTVIATIVVGTEPLGIAVNPGGTRAYVANRLSNSVSVIDTATNTVTATVPVGVNPYGVAFNPAGTRAYVANLFVNNVSVIDTATNTVVATVPVGTGPQGVAVNPAGTRVYVANNSSNTVSVIDTAGNTVVATVPVGTSPVGVAIDPTGTRAYVANNSSNNVSVIDTPTNTVIATVPVGTAPAAFGQFIGVAAAATVPNAPVIGTATAGNGSATVTYTPPAFDGGSAVASYTATSSPGGITGVATGGPIIVNGLTNGTPYTFTVTATNLVGTSVPSAPSNSVTPSATPSATISQSGLPVTTAVPGLTVNMSITVSGGAGTPTGSVTVNLRNLSTGGVSDINGLTCRSVGLTSGSFTCPFVTPAAGNYQVEVNYSGDGTYPANLTSFPLVTVKAVPTIAQVGSPASAVPGQSVSMAITVASSSPLGPPSGTVTVNLHNLSTNGVADINGLTCRSGGLTAGAFTCPYVTPASGSYQVEVNYSGDTPNAPVLAVFPLVTAQVVPTITQAGSPASAVPGQSVSMAITVASSSPLGPPSGTVTVNLHNLSTNGVADINGLTCRSGALTTGSFTCPYVTPAAGNYQVEVNYSGDVPNAPLQTVFSLVTAQVVPTITQVGSPASAVPGQSVSMAITVASSSPLGPPSGTVTVNLHDLSTNGVADINGLTCRSVGLTAGAFTCPYVTPASGSYQVEVNYSGDTPNAPVLAVFPLLVVPPGPIFSPSATIFTFASQVLATTSVAQTLTITNTGTAVLNSIGPAITGPFSITLNTCTGVAPAGTCTISFTFTPAAIGAASGTLSIPTNAAGSPHVISLSGTGVAAPAPAVTLSPAGPLNFGTVTVNTSSGAQVVTLTNSGTAALNIVGITSTGDFGFTTNCPFSTAPLAAAASCTISITFSPLSIAALTGNVTITSTAPGSPHAIALTGTGSAVPVAGIGLSPTSLAFGSQGIGTTSALQTVVVTNTGFATLTLLGTSVSPPFARVAIGAAQGDCAASLAPSLSCQIAIAFTPTAIGAASGTLSITDNAGGSPHQVSLTGTGASAAIPQISVATALDFGDQIVNTGGTKPLVIGNPGSAPLTITGLTITGSNAGQFATSGNCTTVAPGASCTLTVNFLPATTGAKTAQLTIASNAAPNPNAAATPVTVNLTGNGILAPRPIAKLSVTGLGFGNVIFGGATPNQLITLSNIGGVAMSIAAIQATGDYMQMNSCTATLAPNASCSINVLFSPLGLGSRLGELQVYTNADGSPHRVQLGGTGCRWFSQSQSRFLLTACG